MNNSELNTEQEEVTLNDQIPWLRNRDSELVRIIEALGRLSNTKDWSTLKNYVFDGVTENLERRLASEASKMPLNDKEIYKLQGQLVWARKYSDLENLTNIF